jgi:hypothetical protein
MERLAAPLEYLTRHLRSLLNHGDPIGRPASVEPVRHANRQTDRRDRLPDEVLGVKSDHVAEDP